MGCLLVASLKGALYFSSSLRLSIIQTYSTLKMDIASLLEFLENLTFLLNLAIVTSMSYALVASS